MILPRNKRERFTDALIASGKTDMQPRCDSLYAGIRIAPSGSTARFRRAIVVAAISLALTGCSAAMTRNTASGHSGDRHESMGAEWPLKFKAHYFSVSTYSTYGCKVQYGGRPRVDDPEDELQSSSEALGGKYPNNMTARMGPIGNFPPPAKVTWRSKDGTPLEAEIDIGEIFKDELIRHNVPKEDIPANTLVSDHAPGIILEVNDRTINVYMRAFISTKQPQKPGNKHSNYRDDLIKVFSRTY